jgi:hypothetical protein
MLASLLLDEYTSPVKFALGIHGLSSAELKREVGEFA